MYNHWRRGPNARASRWTYPVTGVSRQIVPLKRIALTDLKWKLDVMQDKNPWRKHGPQRWYVIHTQTYRERLHGRFSLPPTGLHWSDCPIHTHAHTTHTLTKTLSPPFKHSLVEMERYKLGQKNSSKEERASSNDFTRFKVARAKSQRNKLARQNAGL